VFTSGTESRTSTPLRLSGRSLDVFLPIWFVRLMYPIHAFSLARAHSRSFNAITGTAGTEHPGGGGERGYCPWSVLRLWLIWFLAYLCLSDCDKSGEVDEYGELHRTDKCVSLLEHVKDDGGSRIVYVGKNACSPNGFEQRTLRR
jgi:hypothetical protein